MRTKEEQEASKIRRAWHQVLNGYLWDSHRTLMQPGMVPLTDKEVQLQIHSLHEFEDDPVLMPTANDFATKCMGAEDAVHSCEVLCNDCACRSSKGGSSCRLVPQDSKCEKASGSS